MQFLVGEIVGGRTLVETGFHRYRWVFGANVTQAILGELTISHAFCRKGHWLLFFDLCLWALFGFRAFVTFGFGVSNGGAEQGGPQNQ